MLVGRGGSPATRVAILPVPLVYLPLATHLPHFVDHLYPLIPPPVPLASPYLVSLPRLQFCAARRAMTGRSEVEGGEGQKVHGEHKEGKNKQCPAEKYEALPAD